MDPLLTSILSGIISGLVSGYIIAGFIKRTFEADDEEESEADLVVNIEFQDSYMLLYNKKTNEFIAQGSNWETVIEVLTNKYPNKTILIENKQLEQAKNFGQGK